MQDSSALTPLQLKLAQGHLSSISSCPKHSFSPLFSSTSPSHPTSPLPYSILTWLSHTHVPVHYVHGLLRVSRLLTNPEVSGTNCKTTPLHAGIPLCVHSIHCHSQCIRYPTQVGGAWEILQRVATPSNTYSNTYNIHTCFKQVHRRPSVFCLQCKLCATVVI